MPATRGLQPKHWVIPLADDGYWPSWILGIVPADTISSFTVWRVPSGFLFHDHKKCAFVKQLLSSGDETSVFAFYASLDLPVTFSVFKMIQYIYKLTELQKKHY